MLLRETWHDCLVRWHSWWWNTHTHASESASTDATSFFIEADPESVIVSQSVANAEAFRLLKIAKSEQAKAARHTAKLYELVDKRLERLVG